MLLPQWSFMCNAAVPGNVSSAQRRLQMFVEVGYFLSYWEWRNRANSVIGMSRKQRVKGHRVPDLYRENMTYIQHRKHLEHKHKQWALSAGTSQWKCSSCLSVCTVFVWTRWVVVYSVYISTSPPFKAAWICKQSSGSQRRAFFLLVLEPKLCFWCCCTAGDKKEHTKVVRYRRRKSVALTSVTVRFPLWLYCTVWASSSSPVSHKSQMETLMMLISLLFKFV